MYWDSPNEGMNPLKDGWIFGNIVLAFVLGTICYFLQGDFAGTDALIPWWQLVGGFILARILMVVMLIVVGAAVIGLFYVLNKGWNKFDEWLNDG